MATEWIKGPHTPHQSLSPGEGKNDKILNLLPQKPQKTRGPPRILRHSWQMFDEGGERETGPRDRGYGTELRTCKLNPDPDHQPPKPETKGLVGMGNGTQKHWLGF